MRDWAVAPAEKTGVAGAVIVRAPEPSASSVGLSAIVWASQAADVIVASTHAVFSGPAVDRLKNSRISEVVVTNTLPLSEEKRFDKLTELSIAPLIARAIREVFDDGSVTSLFDGNA